MTSRKHVLKAEKTQRKLDAGFMAAHYPEVSSIVVNMMYNQQGVKQTLPRTVNFLPTSYAFFRVDCLSKECVEGGFDLSQVITAMIRSRKKAAKGELNCSGGPAPDHSAIVYEVAIEYA
jgi:hypothetical protein